jgi:hypothetical protein
MTSKMLEGNVVSIFRKVALGILPILLKKRQKIKRSIFSIEITKHDSRIDKSRCGGVSLLL